MASLSLILLLATGCGDSNGDQAAYPLPTWPPAPAVQTPAPTGVTPTQAMPAGEPVRTPEPTGGIQFEEPPGPVSADVTELPIWVKSTADHYFVLYARYGDAEYPVLVKLGEEGATLLTENVPMLPPERYRVERHSILNPGDADGDGVDDLTELRSPSHMSPVNPAAAVNLQDGAVSIADHETFERMGVRLEGHQTVKFVVFGLQQNQPGVVFLNAEVFRHHEPFAAAVGLKGNPLYEDRVRGYIVRGRVDSAGAEDLYHFHLLDRDMDFDTVDRIYTVLAANLPVLEGNLRLWIRNYQIAGLQAEFSLYEESRIPLLFNQDVYGHIPFEVLNPGTAYGLLRYIAPGERPHPRDIVIYQTLPNNLPMVAGVITTVPQTPLSHVNLRAVQNGIPNMYVRDILRDHEALFLLDRYVRLEVVGRGAYGSGVEYSLRAATKEEADAHLEESRPAEPQAPERDLTVTEITPLSEIGFDDWTAFGVKAANVAELGKLGFPEGTIPDGFAIPFYFYDQFMQHNGFHALVLEMLEHPEFQSDLEVQRKVLGQLRGIIESAEVPDWMLEAIEDMNRQFDGAFGEGLNRRYRSSTNNEDLPGFNGAGLYSSKSQKPSEDREDIGKSLKEVYASLWNYRAFIEREFHRIDHMQAAMGILVHPSYRDELVNGVAASFDPTPGAGAGTFYVNSQVGEYLVTNPEPHSLPEELRLGEGLAGGKNYEVIETSSLLPRGRLLMTDGQIEQLRMHLDVIHDHFRELYGADANERYAVEIEFKITAENQLAIKQVRPWVFPTRGTSAADRG